MGRKSADASRNGFTPQERREIRLRLLRWYGWHARRLPWRTNPTPYRTWIAEAMLQQTRVETVIPYYRRFLRQFPSVKSLAEASEEELLKAWEGLGYYSRCRNLRHAARMIRSEMGGRFPRTEQGMRSLPGIGRYTAGAVRSIAMGHDAAAVDGNVTRVLARLLDDHRDTSTAKAVGFFWDVAEALVPRGRAGDFNQGVMDLGATVCQPRTPQCEACPLADLCRARRAGTQGDLPRRRKRRPVPHYTIGVGVVWKGRRVLIARRPSDGLLGGLWEFPGGKLEGGESLPECVRREVREEVGIDASVDEHMLTVGHAYSHFRVTLHFYACTYVKGRPRALGCSDWKWARPDELAQYAFPAGSAKAVTAVVEQGRNATRRKGTTK